MKKGNGKVLILMLTCIVMLLFTGCRIHIDLGSNAGGVEAPKADRKIDSLEKAWLFVSDGTLEIDLASNTVSHKQFDPETHQSNAAEQTTLSGTDAVQYRELVTKLCQELLDREGEYYDGATIHGEYVKTSWEMWFFYDEGAEKRMRVLDGAKRQYPDCWDEFVTKTKQLTGLDVNGLMSRQKR